MFNVLRAKKATGSPAILKLNHYFGLVGAEIQKLSKAAFEIDGISQLLGKMLSKQEQYLDSFGGSFRELAASAEEVSATCESVSTRVEHVTAKAQNSSADISELAKITAELNESKASLQELASAMVEVRKSIDLINDIIFQTKILSFNASVEAVRAGPAGKGFAVVAHEVRNLSDSTREAASAIYRSMESGQASVDRMTQVLSKRIEEVTRISEKTSKSFEEIHTEIAEVSSAVSQISIGSREQSNALQASLKTLESFLSISNRNKEVIRELGEIKTELSEGSHRTVEILKDTVSDPAAHAGPELLFHYNAAKILGRISNKIESTSDVKSLLQEAVDSVCENTEWKIASVFIPDARGVSRFGGIWHLDPQFRNSEFARKTESVEFQPGKGLPGRVYQGKQLAYIPDVCADSNYARAEFAREIGIVSAMCFPVITRSGTVLAAVEYYALGELEPDPALVEVLRQIGQIIGQVSLSASILSQFETSTNEATRNAA